MLRRLRAGPAELELAVGALKDGPVRTGATPMTYPLHQSAVRLYHTEGVRARDSHGGGHALLKASVWLMRVSMRVAVSDVVMDGTSSDRALHVSVLPLVFKG